ncbi:unnamed protein product [Euphydryas editha]|uniref:Uncharacterized protein n=1 Tax=Euphydryas editha TaxID=104508 RepID=A0AAU9TX26_EUPED|nr:unnamed protein product [Euphydryas editha]
MAIKGFGELIGLFLAVAFCITCPEYDPKFITAAENQMVMIKVKFNPKMYLANQSEKEDNDSDCRMREKW